MEKDLVYFRRRLAEERAAARSAVHPSVRSAHHELAHLYEERVAELQARGRRVEMRLVSAA